VSAPDHSEQTEPRLNVVLVEPEIPPNTGNVGRLCLATGCRLHLVGPLGFSLDEKQLRRAGLDYWEKVDLMTWDSFDALRESVGDDSRFTYFTTKTQRRFWDARFQVGHYLVFGRETKGLPESLLEQAQDRCVTIPMEERGRSLNLATSVGIGVYEALRQLS
jgi:tRNA (cytidine/uridine-2'-O-)-methyltransferase